MIEFDPFKTVVTCAMAKPDSECKLQELLFCVNKLLKIFVTGYIVYFI